MKFGKVLLESEFSAKNKYYFFYNLLENNILEYVKYYKDGVHDFKEDEIEEFDQFGKPDVMKHPTEPEVVLKKHRSSLVDLNNIDEKLCTENANILYAIGETFDIGLYNRDIETYISKMPNEATRSIYAHSIVFNIFMQSRSRGVNEVIFHVHDRDEVYINIDNVIDYGDTYPTVDKIKLKLEGSEAIDSDGMTEISAQLVDMSGQDINDIATVYLKTNAGTLSHSKITTDQNGLARFRVKADMLVAGDKIKIKAGFKFFTNIINKEIDVI